jgi:hypothetical protein
MKCDDLEHFPEHFQVEMFDVIFMEQWLVVNLPTIIAALPVFTW